MAYQFLFSTQAKKDIDSFESEVKKRIAKRLTLLSECDDILFFAKKLSGTQLPQYRIRIGHYRVVVDIMGKKVFVLRIQHRKDVYR
jgi:mRNA-degrading endonuclease RelE of RelBE toxin-antitoxin system